MRNAIELTARWSATIIITFFIESMITFGAVVTVSPMEWPWWAWMLQVCVAYITFYVSVIWTEHDASQNVSSTKPFQS